MHDALPTQRRAIAKWDQLCHLTGLAMGGKQTGWDRLAQVILDDSAIRLRAMCRLEAIVNLCRLLTPLGQTHFVVLAMRFGLTVDDQDVAARSRQDISEKLTLSVSRVAQLEHEAIDNLRERMEIEFPNVADFVYRTNGNHAAPGDTSNAHH